MERLPVGNPAPSKVRKAEVVAAGVAGRGLTILPLSSLSSMQKYYIMLLSHFSSSDAYQARFLLASLSSAWPGSRLEDLLNY